MHRTVLPARALLAACVWLAACVPAYAPPPRLEPAPRSVPAPPGGAAAGARLIVSFLPTQDPANARVYEILRGTPDFADLAADLNRWFAFPTPVLVSFEDCGQVNAFYDPDRRAISMCYELVRYYTDVLLSGYDVTPEEYENEVIYSALFTFFHELGHALVHVFELPITGREEDAVDQFASILLIELDAADAVLAGMEQFDVDAEEDEQLEEIPYWGEHGLSAQRVYNLACFTYGSDPIAHADLVANGELPMERADRCPGEYQLARDSWDRLLAPHER